MQWKLIYYTLNCLSDNKATNIPCLIILTIIIINYGILLYLGIYTTCYGIILFYSHGQAANICRRYYYNLVNKHVRY